MLRLDTAWFIKNVRWKLIAIKLAIWVKFKSLYTAQIEQLKQDLNIYIDNHLAFRYDEESGTLVDAEDSGIKHIKTNDDPCATIYSYCK